MSSEEPWPEPWLWEKWGQYSLRSLQTFFSRYQHFFSSFKPEISRYQHFESAKNFIWKAFFKIWGPISRYQLFWYLKKKVWVVQCATLLACNWRSIGPPLKSHPFVEKVLRVLPFGSLRTFMETRMEIVSWLWNHIMFTNIHEIPLLWQGESHFLMLLALLYAFLTLGTPRIWEPRKNL